MERLSATALRARAAEKNAPVSWKQFQSFEEWGLIPEQPSGGWTDADIERLQQICKLKPVARSLHRRTILLHNGRWPVPGKHLRQAMVDTIPSIEGPIKKMRLLYRALRVMHGDMPIARAARLSLPADWHTPDTGEWQHTFRWPTDDEFAWIAEVAYAEAQAVTLSRIVRQSAFLEGVPYEEIIVLLMTRQLTIPPQVFPDPDDLIASETKRP